MHSMDAGAWEHSHTFGMDERREGERRTRWVVGLTLIMMGVEVAGGLAFGSMALLADGWHMGTHAAALGVALFAYAYARRHATDSHYSFGTGKVGALGGFASAVGLAVVAVMILAESALRLWQPTAIRFDEAIAVAVVGLLVNLASAVMLRGADHPHHHPHDHGGEHGGGHGAHHHDHNLRGAYLHVMADALTSVLAIAALLAGQRFGWMWMDPAMGIVGSLVISRWSYGLLQETSAVLLDAEVSAQRRGEIRDAVESDADSRVVDLHLWRVGPRHLAAVVAVVCHEPREPQHYKGLLAGFADLAHVTVEVHRCPGDTP